VPDPEVRSVSDRPSALPQRSFPISLVMIVRDEERCLARCLESVTGLVDEIVIVDTGSTDRTIEIAESFGAKVAPFAWIDDFAAARNASLELALHPWRLVLDADEWIVDRRSAAATLDALASTPPDTIGLATVVQVDEATGRLAPGSGLPIPRLLPAHVRYEGIVHEQPTPRTETFGVDLTIGHDGYTSQSNARKEGRNIALLEAAIAADQTNAYFWFQLGSDHLTYGRLEDGLSALVRCYNLLRDVTGAPSAERRSWEHVLVVRLMQTLMLLRRIDEAAAVGEQEAEHWLDSSVFFSMFGEAVRLRGVLAASSDAAFAEQLFDVAAGLWQHALEQGDKPEYAGALAGGGTAFATEGLTRLRGARP
jgi:hypothetical protein